MFKTHKMPMAVAAGALLAFATWTVARTNARNGRDQAAAERRTAPDVPTVMVASVQSYVLDRPILLPGDLVAFEDVEIRPRVAGFVASIKVDRGSVVKKGQLLAEIAAPELAAQRAEAEAKIQAAQSQRIEAEAKLASDEATYQRLERASATPGVVAGNDVEIAEKAAAADRARVEQWIQNERAARDAARSIRDMESYLRLTAPFAGVVTDRGVHPGSLVGPTSTPMLRLQQVSRLRLVVAVPENAVAGTQPGKVVKFTVPAYPGETFSGTIARVGHALDVKTRTMPVELDVANPTGSLAPGMFASVAWSMRRQRPSLFVPSAAIATTTERTFVVRVRNGHAEWVDVKRGSPMNQLVEVFGDLREGDQVAIRGTDEIRQGSLVNVKLVASNP
jgi:membrane fusion protein (multidrug efflux system)